MPDSPVDPRKSRLLQLLMLAAAITLFTIAWLSVDAFRHYRFVERQLPAMIQIEELEGQILLLDEVLGMSVQMAAATGDPQWEARYRQSEPELHKSIKALKHLAPRAASSPAAVKMDTAGIELTAMDNYIFHLVGQGQRVAAHEYVQSQEYQARKKIYFDGVQDFEHAAWETIASLQNERQVQALWGAGAASLLIPLLVLGWGSIWRTVRRWQMALVENNRQLNEKAAELEESNRQLEGRVSERTKAFNDSALASLNMMEDAVRQRENAEQAYVKLEQTTTQLVEASRQRGMAEVATSVLHNVGNVLNSVNVSASLVEENVKSSRAASLAKVVALLREHEADLGSYISGDPKGRHIPALLEQLADDWLGQQQVVSRELQSLRANIDHIKEIVAMQQTHAKVAGFPEIVNVSDLVEDSLRMNAGALIENRVRVIREFEEVPPISVEKHKVLQILVNLVRNAKHACDNLEHAKKRMTLRIAQAGGRIRISVSDNGEGIAPENLTRIFAHGFTTRKDGHGFGLHSGALAATELGGSLSVQSEGPGKGATFTLELAQQPPGVIA